MHPARKKLEIVEFDYREEKKRQNAILEAKKAKDD